MTKKEREQKEAVDTLKQWGLKDGSTVYAKVNKVSASGMMRNIGLYIVPAAECRPVDIAYHAAKALGWPYKDGYDGGVSVSGCGMDMLFATIDALSYSMGYGAINQEHHDQHIKYGAREGCAECAIAAGVKMEHIGLKYRQL